MFHSIRIVKLLLILAVAGVCFVFPPGLGSSVASSGGQGIDPPILTGEQDKGLGDGGTDGSDPDEFGIYTSTGHKHGKTPVAVGVLTDEKNPTRELSGFWIAVLRIVWMVRH